MQIGKILKYLSVTNEFHYSLYLHIEKRSLTIPKKNSLEASINLIKLNNYPALFTGRYFNNFLQSLVT